MTCVLDPPLLVFKPLTPLEFPWPLSPRPLQNFQFPSWRGSGYILETHYGKKKFSSLLPFRKQERKTLTQDLNCKLKDEKIFLLNLRRCPIPLSCMLLFHTHPEMILYQSKSEHHTAAVIQNNIIQKFE